MLYPKIPNVFERDNDTKKLIIGEYKSLDVEYLAHNNWIFTEKIDGTNIRIIWDGYRVSFGGRTDKAEIPSHLMERLTELFGGESNEELFEQTFGNKPVVLFGEGYGPKIQSGGNYRDSVDFILFDTCINNSFVPRVGNESIAGSLGIDVVPICLCGTIMEAVEFVKSKPDSKFGTAKIEGVVGTPYRGLNDRYGERIIVKIKCRDF